MKNKTAFFLAVMGAASQIFLFTGCGAGLDSGAGGGGIEASSRFAEIPEGTFIASSPPGPSITQHAPRATNATGNTDMINGGSGSFTVDFTDPDSLSSVASLVVFFQGDDGYFKIPINSPGSGSVKISMVMAEDLHQDLVIKFALIDQEGNVSNYVEKNIVIHQTGTGDIKISLSWDQPEDLDLHVIEPSGEEIYWKHPQSPSGGRLDLDSNADCDIDNVDNEDIFWPPGSAPRGTYKVRVNYFGHCSAGAVNYIVTLIIGSEVKTFHGGFNAAEQGQTRNITEFSY